MPIVNVQRDIRAPASLVFRTVSHIEGFPDTSPDVLRVEFLTRQRAGVGTRFRETRRMGSSELQTELEVVEYDREARQVRMVADTDGTVWDTRFVVSVVDGGCRLTISMDARGSTWVKRLMNILMQGLFKRGIRGHLNDLAAYCEGHADTVSAIKS
jgi:hypothetical protein